MAGYTVGGDHSMGIDEGIVLHNPECHVIFWFDGVVSNVLERVAYNFKSEACFFDASGNSEALITKCCADAVVCIKDLVVYNFDISKNIPRHEQGAIQRAPEMMVHHTPRHVRPDGPPPLVWRG